MFGDVVGLLRNGLCVLADTFPATNLVHQNATFVGDYYVGAELSPSWINMCIAPLQFIGGLLNLHGCLSLYGAFAGLLLAVRQLRTAEKSRRELAVVVAKSDFSDARVRLMVGVMKLLIGPCFIVLSMNSLKIFGDDAVQYALVVMQVALCLGLIAMCEEIAKRATLSVVAQVAARSKSPDEILLSLDCCGFGITKKEKQFVIVKGGSSLSAALFADGCSDDELSGRVDLLEATAKKQSSVVESDLESVSRREWNGAALEALYLLLNLVAFAGYFVFPLTFFGFFNANDSIMWLGNLAGDVAWTVEPFVALLALTPFWFAKGTVKVMITLVLMSAFESFQLGFLFGVALFASPI